jgi:hypothetical protein
MFNAQFAYIGSVQYVKLIKIGRVKTNNFS